MTIDTLRQFEWHDLPLEEIRLTGDGVQLVISPFNEKQNRYDRFRLSIDAPTTLVIALRGELSAKQMRNLEICSFKFEESDSGKLNGELGILPGSAGFWKISFQEASWTLVPLDRKSSGDVE